MSMESQSGWQHALQLAPAAEDRGAPARCRLGEGVVYYHDRGMPPALLGSSDCRHASSTRSGQ